MKPRGRDKIQIERSSERALEMPIESEIDHERRLVTARGRGTLTHEDVFGYQRDVCLGVSTEVSETPALAEARRPLS
jgi:hypothetical protein